MEKRSVFWAGVAIFGILMSMTAYTAQRNALLLGPFPMRSSYEGFAKDYGWLRRLPRFNPFTPSNNPSKNTSNKAPSEPPQPSTIEAIKTTKGSLYFLNHHKQLVNQRLQEAIQYFEQKYNKEVWLPNKRSQAHLRTHNGDKVKATFIMENKQFQKACKGWVGNNVYGTVKSEQQFYVKEVKLFLNGNFDKAEHLAKINYGRKYTIEKHKATILPKVSANLGIELLILALAYIKRHILTVGTFALGALSFTTGTFGIYPAIFFTINALVKATRYGTPPQHKYTTISP